MPAGTAIAPPRCHPPPDGGTLRHVNNSLPGPLSEGSVHGNGSRQPDNWLSALAEPFVTVLAHGNGVYGTFGNVIKFILITRYVYKQRNIVFRKGLHFDESYGRNHSAGSRHCSGHLLEKYGSYENH